LSVDSIILVGAASTVLFAGCSLRSSPVSFYVDDKTSDVSGLPPQQWARRIIERFMNKERHPANYRTDLTLEAILTFYDHTSDERLLSYVREDIRNRGVHPGSPVSYHAQPFCCITFELFGRTGEKEFIQPFIDETHTYRKEAVRDKDGAVRHTSRNPRGILIDYLQDYASRMAKAGYLSRDTTFFDECVQQYQIHHRILRNPKTGLWSQGRGWLQDPCELSPGAWSRGHGWLIRGMVDSLRYLPPESKWSKTMRGMLEELATDLLKYQDEDGMWHQLLHLPFCRSFPESSGTALISYNISRAIKEGYLKGAEFEWAVRKAVAALEKCVTSEGVVLHACKGPGPLYSIDSYVNKAAAPDDPHGAPTLIFGAIGGMLLEERN
jgi:unsaturated rhamnogalacturonyl hydrolase